MQEERTNCKKRISYFLFVNSKSGGEKGKTYLTIPNRKLSFNYNTHTLVTLHLIDLFDPQEKEKGIHKIARLLDKVQHG